MERYLLEQAAPAPTTLVPSRVLTENSAVQVSVPLDADRLQELEKTVKGFQSSINDLLGRSETHTTQHAQMWAKFEHTLMIEAQKAKCSNESCWNIGLLSGAAQGTKHCCSCMKWFCEKCLKDGICGECRKTREAYKLRPASCGAQQGEYTVIWHQDKEGFDRAAGFQHEVCANEEDAKSMIDALRGSFYSFLTVGPNGDFDAAKSKHDMDVKWMVMLILYYRYDLQLAPERKRKEDEVKAMLQRMNIRYEELEGQVATLFRAYQREKDNQKAVPSISPVQATPESAPSATGGEESLVEDLRRRVQELEQRTQDLVASYANLELGHGITRDQLRNRNEELKRKEELRAQNLRLVLQDIGEDTTTTMPDLLGKLWKELSKLKAKSKSYDDYFDKKHQWEVDIEDRSTRFEELLETSVEMLKTQKSRMEVSLAELEAKQKKAVEDKITGCETRLKEAEGLAASAESAAKDALRAIGLLQQEHKDQQNKLFGELTRTEETMTKLKRELYSKMENLVQDLTSKMSSLLQQDARTLQPKVEKLEREMDSVTSMAETCMRLLSRTAASTSSSTSAGASGVSALQSSPAIRREEVKEPDWCVVSSPKSEADRARPASGAHTRAAVTKVQPEKEETPTIKIPFAAAAQLPLDASSSVRMPTIPIQAPSATAPLQGLPTRAVRPATTSSTGKAEVSMAPREPERPLRTSTPVRAESTPSAEAKMPLGEGAGAREAPVFIMAKPFIHENKYTDPAILEVVKEAEKELMDLACSGDLRASEIRKKVLLSWHPDKSMNNPVLKDKPQELLQIPVRFVNSKHVTDWLKDLEEKGYIPK